MSGFPPSALVLTAHYPPEPTGNAPYAGSLARGLAKLGTRTTVLTTHPHYPGWRFAAGYGGWARTESIDDVAVHRLRHLLHTGGSGVRRALSEASIGIRQSAKPWGQPSVIIAASPALLATWITTIRRRITHRRTPLVVWVQDLYTLGLRETGAGNRLLERAMKAIEQSVLLSATRVVVIHERFAEIVVAEFNVPMDRVEVVRNWTHLPPSNGHAQREETRLRLGWKANEIVVLHAGNMGVKQGLDNVIEAARIADLQSAPIRFVLLGSGSEREALGNLAESVSRVQFIEPLPKEEFPAALRAADVLLVNERAGVAEMAVPSKLTSYFDAGRPVLAATEAHGITAEELERAQGGISVPSGDPAALLTAALELGQDADRARQLGDNGIRYRRTVLDEETAIGKFATILSEVIAPAARVANPEFDQKERTTS